MKIRNALGKVSYETRQRYHCYNALVIIEGKSGPSIAYTKATYSLYTYINLTC